MLGVAAKHFYRSNPCLAAGTLSRASLLDRLRTETDNRVTSIAAFLPFLQQQVSSISTSAAVCKSKGRRDDKHELRRRMDERLGEQAKGAKAGLPEDIPQEVETAAETEPAPEVDARMTATPAPEDITAAAGVEASREPTPDTGASTSGSEGAMEEAVRKPLRVYVHEPAPMARPDPRFGYSALGIAPEVPSGPDEQGRSGQLNPRRIFYPSQTYNAPELLVTDGETESWMTSREWAKKKVKMPSNLEVMEQADFRNLAFLSQYVTEMGKLIPRRKTRLQQKVQRHLCRQIKTARSMGLLPPLSKLFEFEPH